MYVYNFRDSLRNLFLQLSLFSLFGLIFSLSKCHPPQSQSIPKRVFLSHFQLQNYWILKINCFSILMLMLNNFTIILKIVIYCQKLHEIAQQIQQTGLHLRSPIQDCWRTAQPLSPNTLPNNLFSMIIFIGDKIF